MYNFIEKLKSTFSTLKEKKQFVFIAIPFGLILLFIVFAIFSQSPQENPDQQPPPTSTSSDNIPTPTLTEEKLLELQAQFEEEYAEEQAEVQRKYPWFDRLPLQEETYFVYMDSETDRFVGLLYPKLSSQVSEEEQVAAMKQEINTSLTNLGIDVSKYPFDWKVTPEL